MHIRFKLQQPASGVVATGVRVDLNEETSERAVWLVGLEKAM